MLVDNDQSFGDLAKKSIEEQNVTIRGTYQSNIKALELNRKIVTEILNGKLSILVHVLNQKVLTKQMKSFQYMKNCENQRNRVIRQMECQNENMELWVSKVEEAKESQRLALLGKGFFQIWMKGRKNRGEERKVSTKNLEGRKIAESQKNKSSNNETELIKRQNEQLKKKKQKLKNNVLDFYSKIDKLLTSHEAYLKK